jgi:leucyl aminopeptidase
MKNQGWISLAGLAFLLSSPTAWTLSAATGDEGLRLIQTATQRAWMTQGEIAELAKKSHAEGHCGGFKDITDHPDQEKFFQPAFVPFEGLPAPHHQVQVNQLIAELSADRLLAQVTQLSSYPNRFYKSQTGVQSATWIRDQFLALAKGRTDVSAELFKHARFDQPSVIVKIAGHGPHAQEHVILGAHEDSVNWSTGYPTPSDKAPGADDDASGVATLLETFRVLIDSNYQPDRTLEFMTYAGEELGLLGSQDIAQKYKKDGVQVVGVYQMDMTFYPSDTPQIHMISDYTNRAMTQFTEMLVDTYVHVQWVEMECGYACSDHASWDKAGYASAFPFEAPMESYDPKIHTAEDTTEILTPSFGLHFAKLAVAWAVELSSP